MVQPTQGALRLALPLICSSFIPVGCLLVILIDAEPITVGLAKPTLSRGYNAYGLEGEGDDSLGYDFSYRDIDNQLAGRLDRPLCYIEVKSSSGDGSEPFQMTINEWEKARECHQASDSVYIIMRVARVRDDPRITDVIIDPFGLYGAGQIAVASRDLWIHVGSPEPVREAHDGLQPVASGREDLGATPAGAV